MANASGPAAQFRLASAQDAELIHQLLGEMAQAEGGRIAGNAQSLRQYGWGDTPRFRVVLAVAQDQPLGLVLFFPEYSSWRGEMGVYVQDLYLRPTARGQGLGRALLAQAMQAAQDWQPQFMTLMVAHKNQTGRAFYDALGFAPRDAASPLILAGEGLRALITP